MLSPGHPHAWDVDHAHEHLDPAFRSKYIAQGGTLIPTPEMRQLVASMPAALDRGTATVVSGPYGSGKSTALHALAAVADVNTVVVDISKGLSGRQVWEAIAGALHHQPTTGTAVQLQRATVDYLTTVPTLLVVDEAQYIGKDALMQLRWLWDRVFPRFAIVLAGSDLTDVIDKMPAIGTRISQRIQLRRPAGPKMVDLIRRHHPAAASADPRLLADIDTIYANASWRLWSTLLLTVTNDLGHAGPLDHEIAAAAIHHITGTRPALARPVTPMRTP